MFCFRTEQSEHFQALPGRGCLEHQNCLLSPLPIKTKTGRFYYSCVLLPFHLAEHYWMLSLCQSHLILSLCLQPFRSGIDFLTTLSRNCEIWAFLRALCSGGSGLHPPCSCWMSLFPSRRQRKSQTLSNCSGCSEFCILKSIFDAAGKCLHECLWINPCQCGQAHVHLHVKMHRFPDWKILPDK